MSHHIWTGCFITKHSQLFMLNLAETEMNLNTCYTSAESLSQQIHSHPSCLSDFIESVFKAFHTTLLLTFLEQSSFTLFVDLRFHYFFFKGPFRKITEE